MYMSQLENKTERTHSSQVSVHFQGFVKMIKFSQKQSMFVASMVKNTSNYKTQGSVLIVDVVFFEVVLVSFCLLNLFSACCYHLFASS